MKVQIAVVIAALATGCVATTGGYVATQPVQPVVTADVNVQAQTDPPPADPAPADPVADTEPADDNTYDDDLYEGEPDLVELNSNVRVVYGADDAVFYSDGYYWRYGDNGTWYRSSVYNGGWGVYTDIPVHIRTIERPVQYRRYKPATYTPRARKVGVRPAKSRPSYARPVRNNNRPAVRNDNRPGNYDKRPTRNDNRPGNVKTQPTRNDNRPGNYDKPKDARPAQQPTRTDNRPGGYDKPGNKPDTRPTKAEPPKPTPKKDPPPKKKDDDYKKKKK